MSNSTLQILPNTCSPEDIVAAIDADGACIIKDLIDTELVQRTTDEVMPYIEQTAMGLDDFTGKKTQRTGALVARSPACRELILNPAILASTKTFLGPYTDKIILHLTQTIRIHPGNPAQPLHRDRLAWGTHMPPSIEPQLNTIWALTDFNAENGATRCVPGSHKWDWQQRAQDNEIVQAEMSAGSVFIYTGSVLHSGGENRSDSTKAGVKSHLYPRLATPGRKSISFLSSTYRQRSSTRITGTVRLYTRQLRTRLLQRPRKSTRKIRHSCPRTFTRSPT